MPIEIQVTAGQCLNIIACGREVGYSFHECETLIRSGKTEKEILEIFNKALRYRQNPKPSTIRVIK
tara:strand:- start:54 stop:251 length:198 start_codon:yes stop_codon:yes gene_type:complete